MTNEVFFTYDTELNTVHVYGKKDLINRINDYVENFEDEEYLIKEGDSLTYEDFTGKLENTYSREHLFLVLDIRNYKVLYRNGNELNKELQS